MALLKRPIQPIVPNLRTKEVYEIDNFEIEELEEENREIPILVQKESLPLVEEFKQISSKQSKLNMDEQNSFYPFKFASRRYFAFALGSKDICIFCQNVLTQEYVEIHVVSDLLELIFDLVDNCDPKLHKITSLQKQQYMQFYADISNHRNSHFASNTTRMCKKCCVNCILNTEDGIEKFLQSLDFIFNSISSSEMRGSVHDIYKKYLRKISYKDQSDEKAQESYEKLINFAKEKTNLETSDSITLLRNLVDKICEEDSRKDQNKLIDNLKSNVRNLEFLQSVGHTVKTSEVAKHHYEEIERCQAELKTYIVNKSLLNELCSLDLNFMIELALRNVEGIKNSFKLIDTFVLDRNGDPAKINHSLEKLSDNLKENAKKMMHFIREQSLFSKTDLVIKYLENDINEKYLNELSAPELEAWEEAKRMTAREME